MTINMRLALASDFQRIAALLIDSHLPWTDLTSDHINEFLVSTDGPLLLGAVGLECYGQYGLLRSLVIRPGARSNGLGQQLVTAIENRATQMGVRELYLLTTTAREYFLRRGYIEIPRTGAPDLMQAISEFASMCPASAVCMTKKLMD